MYSSKRCDINFDCKDQSDELNCDYLSLGANYGSELIPRDDPKKPCLVHMNVSVLAFPEIDTVHLKFTADVYLRLRWYDFRIAFKDLNDVTTLNSLSRQDRDAIWSPKLDFLNALGPYQTVRDDLTSGVLVRQGNPLPEDTRYSTEGKVEEYSL